MQTSRFQLGLITLLAAGLGHALSSSPAAGYPAGPAVSVGSNPVVSAGGSIVTGESDAVLTAPGDQDLILTDLILTSYSLISCKRTHSNTLVLSSGEVLGHFETSSGNSMRYYDYETDSGMSIAHSFSAGLRIPAGETLTLSVTETGNYGSSCGSSSSYGVRYSVSGYLAQP